MRLVIRCTAISLAVGGPFMFFLLWYWGSDDVRPSDIPGTYILRNHDVASSLTLQSDQTFQEEIAANEQVRRAHGSWKLVGESGLIFSPEFLPLPGQTDRPRRSSRRRYHEEIRRNLDQSAYRVQQARLPEKAAAALGITRSPLFSRRLVTLSSLRCGPLPAARPSPL